MDAGGIISDRMFHSRRGPLAVLLCGLVLILAVVMAIFLFSAPQIVGWSAVMIVMVSIGITSLMSSTAATDFGGKAMATCSGVVDTFAYIGSSLQSFSLGFVITHGGWRWWPIYIIPFALAGGGIALWIWNELPAATKKHIAEVEQEQGLTRTEIPFS
ncbi:MAG TPA: hypothetical protein VHG89_05300 [Verrucomicrobiae bacterium]|nr:hypothetical protein [Verrucomicrobiae bacterium]